MKTTTHSSMLHQSQSYYSADLLARSLVRAGFPRYKAYKISHNIWEELGQSKKDENIINRKVLKLLKNKYPELVSSFRKWQKFVKQTKPIILLLGGGTGIGTSTLSVRLAWLLEINQIMGTDSIREVVRRFLPKSLEPILNVSTFEVAEHVKVVKSHKDALIYGFLSQSKKVIYGLEAVIKRAIKEQSSVVVEGVHLVPGEMEFLNQYKSKATIVQVLVDVDKEETHRQHFFKRQLQNANRPKTKYLEHFAEIRLIRNFLVAQAKKNDIPVIENYSLNNAEREIVNTIYKTFSSTKK